MVTWDAGVRVGGHDAADGGGVNVHADIEWRYGGGDDDDGDASCLPSAAVAPDRGGDGDGDGVDAPVSCSQSRYHRREKYRSSVA